MLRIFKGDDTDFADANRLRITIGTAVVLAGCRAEFCFLGVTRQISDASTGTFEVAFTAAETAVMPLGVHCATIRVFDAQGRQRTTTNTLRIEVTDNVDMAYSGENAADVDGHLVVKGVVDDGYGVPADLPEDYTPDEMRTFLNRLAALLRNSMPVAATLLTLAFAPAMGAEVEYARLGSIKATANVVTNVDLSAKADAADVYTKTETDERIVELAPAPGDYEAVSNAAMTAVQPGDLPYSLSTNDVCAIVTNEVVEFTEWNFTLENQDSGRDWAGATFEMEWDAEYNNWSITIWNSGGENIGSTFGNSANPSEDSTSVEFVKDLTYDVLFITATRTRLTRNALGLARLVDLPPLTNGIPEAIASKASTNDVILSPVYQYSWVLNPSTYNGDTIRVKYNGVSSWNLYVTTDTSAIGSTVGPEDATNLLFRAEIDWAGSVDLVATNMPIGIIGYTLGTQTNDFLAALAITNWMASVELLNFVSNALAQSATEYTDDATNELARSFSVPDYANVSNAAKVALTHAKAESGFTVWTVRREGEDVTEKVAQPTFNDANPGWLVEDCIISSDVVSAQYAIGDSSAISLSWRATNEDDSDYFAYTATRTRLPTMADIPTNTTQLVNGNGYVTDTITNGLASSSSVAAAISNADTTYTRFSISAPTNVNQSVQYINITDENPSVLSVKIPEGTGTKDWLIYVQSVTNVSIKLDVATWWMADVAYTNDISPETPTALYFSQIDTGLYLFSRQELAPITISAP